MFSGIARRYDRATDLLSFGVHRRWRRTAVRRSGAAAGGRVLDLATGTADLALAFERHVGSAGRVVALDFSAGMLTMARAKCQHRKSRVALVRGDALAVPFADAGFDVASISF